MQLVFSGRVENSLYHQGSGSYFTVVIVPAPDPFSSPSRFKLRSKEVFAQMGQDVEVTCRVSGTVYAKSYVDKETKQNMQFFDSEVYLDVVESSLKPILSKSSK